MVCCPIFAVHPWQMEERIAQCMLGSERTYFRAYVKYGGPLSGRVGKRVNVCTGFDSLPVMVSIDSSDGECDNLTSQTKSYEI